MQRHFLTSTTALLLCLGPACGDDGGTGGTDGDSDGTSGTGSTSSATDSATDSATGTSGGTSVGTSGATDGTTSGGTTDGTSTGTAGTAGTTGGGVEICDNGSDDDGDSLGDCQDPDCDGEVGGAGGEICELGHEVSCTDAFDNDGDSLVDCDDTDCAGAIACTQCNLDGAMAAVALNPACAFGCPGLINGGMFAVGSAGHAMMVEFPGSNAQPGTLHRLHPDGTFETDINTNLPNGASQIVTAPNGKMYVMGANSVGGISNKIVEINGTTGAAKGVAFEADTGFYTGGLAVDGVGALYFASTNPNAPFYKVTGGNTFEEWGGGNGNNYYAHFGMDGTTLWVATGNGFGKVQEGFGYTAAPWTAPPNHAFRNIEVGADGLIYTLATCAPFTPGCDADGAAQVVRAQPDGLSPQPIIQEAVAIEHMALDDINGDLLLNAYTDGTVCPGGTFGEMYRYKVQ